MQMIDALLIQDAWIVACETNCCEDADLIEDNCRASIICSACGCDVAVGDWDGHCPVCGSADAAAVGLIK